MDNIMNLGEVKNYVAMSQSRIHSGTEAVFDDLLINSRTTNTMQRVRVQLNY